MKSIIKTLTIASAILCYSFCTAQSKYCVSPGIADSLISEAFQNRAKDRVILLQAGQIKLDSIALLSQYRDLSSEILNLKEHVKKEQEIGQWHESLQTTSNEVSDVYKKQARTFKRQRNLLIIAGAVLAGFVIVHQ